MNRADLQVLQRVGWLRPLDVQFADVINRMCGEIDDTLLVAAALASHAIGKKHVCVDLNDVCGKTWQAVFAEVDGADVEQGLSGRVFAAWEQWGSALVAPIVHVATDRQPLESGSALLVLFGRRLYLRRYWNYECRVEQHLSRLAQAQDVGVVPEALLERYFPAAQADELQRQAARQSASRRLSILSGGPGTGKTYTLVRTVALLTEMNQGALRVRIATPTGKAAMRVIQGIGATKAALREEGVAHEILAAIPDEASTIHRLLGSRWGSPYFKHDATNPLGVDLVIVDEASMIDLPLMAKLLDALPANGRLMLVGDRDQLASVDPGRVYADVCRIAEAQGPLQGCLTHLTRSRRFPGDSRIGMLGATIQAGGDAWAVLRQQADDTQLILRESAAIVQHQTGWITHIREGFGVFLAASEPAAALNACGHFSVLCALRKGPFGVETLNRTIERILARDGLKASGQHYDHRLIMITRNTPALGLYNGDMGVVLSNEAGVLEAWFRGADGAPVATPVSLLPAHETAFAITVHKAQGSEFPHVALILPDTPSPVLRRELLYTGITRVRIQDHEGSLTLYAQEDVFRTAVDRLTARMTGLFAS